MAKRSNKEVLEYIEGMKNRLANKKIKQIAIFYADGSEPELIVNKEPVKDIIGIFKSMLVGKFCNILKNPNKKPKGSFTYKKLDEPEI